MEHVVRKLALEVTFASEAMAFAEQDNLSAFASGRLHRALQEVLTECDPSSADVVSLGCIEIDLGTFSPGSYYEEAEAAFRQKLEQAIRLRLAETSHPGVPDEEWKRIPTAGNELEVLVYFLKTGRFPWNFPSRSVGGRAGVEALFSRVVRESGPALWDRLRFAPEAPLVARRLARQFPRESLAELAATVGWIANLPPEAAESHWERRLTGADRADWDALAAHWRARIEAALIGGDPRSLAATWTVLVRDLPDVIAQAAIAVGVRAEVRHRMSFGFPVPMLRDIACILEPSEASFMTEVAGHPEIYAEAAEAADAESPAASNAAGLQARLWEFTFTYLLAERGSRFNRHAYVSSILRQIAAHENIALLDLLVALDAVLDRIDVPGELAPELRGIVAGLLPETGDDAESPENGEIARLPRWEALLRTALPRGDYALLREHWPVMVRDCPDAIRFATRRYGRRRAVRQAIVERFPDSALAGIVVILKPDAAAFVSKLTERPELFSSPSGTPIPKETTKARIWEFTLDYLTADRGSRFNRRAYLESIVRQMAAHENLAVESLALSLAQTVARLGTADPLAAELMPVFESLAGATTAEPEPSLDATIERALLTGHVRTIADSFKEWQNAAPAVLQRVLRRVGVRAQVRARLVDGLPESTLRAIVRILDPAAAAFLSRTIGRQPALAKRHELWRFSLAFLLVEQSSTFRPRAWLASLARQSAVSRATTFSAAAMALARSMRDPDAAKCLRQISLSSAASIARRDDSAAVLRLLNALDTARASIFAGSGDPRSLATALRVLLQTGPEQIGRLLLECRELARAGGLRVPPWLDHDDPAALYRAVAERVTGAGAGSFVAKRPRARSRARLGPEPRPSGSDLPVPDPAGQDAVKWRRLDALDRRLEQVLRRAFAIREVPAAAIARLPEAAVGRILNRLAGAGWSAAWLLADTLADASTRRGAIGSCLAHEIKWRVLLESATAGVLGDAVELLRRLIQAFAAATGTVPGALARNLHTTLQSREIHGRGPARARLLPLLEAMGRSVRLPDSARLETERDIYIANAGLALAAPFLPPLFGRLDLLREGAFLDEEAAGRGAYLLQYLADGKSEAPEHLLVLNKLLCGLPPEAPLRGDVELTPQELAAVDSLLAAMIQHWSAIGHTSPAGLRESFLQREGRLHSAVDSWKLTVSQKAFDMLLDRLPWSYAVIRHPWMQKPIYVEWR